MVAIWSLGGAAPALTIALRRLTHAGLSDQLARGFLAEQFGEAHLRVLVLAQLLIARLADGAERPIALAATCCQRLSRDEAIIVGAVAAGAMGDIGASCAALAELVADEHLVGVASVAAALGEALADSGQPLAPAPRPTIH